MKNHSTVRSGSILTFCGLLLLTAVSCTKYRDVPSKYGTFTPPPTGVIGFGSLRINECVLKGSDGPSSTLLGTTAKWFELYNPTSSNISLTSGSWYVTDDLTSKMKVPVTSASTSPQYLNVPAGGYLIIVCNSTGSSPTPPSPTRFNTNFSLSSSAGDIGIFYQATSSSPLIAIDTVKYNFSATSGKSYGRKPDGQDPFNFTSPLNSVTPEAANN